MLVYSLAVMAYAYPVCAGKIFGSKMLPLMDILINIAKYSFRKNNDTSIFAGVSEINS